MFVVYYDEAGDDGWPGSSPVFVLTSTYMHDSKWKDNFNRVQAFRRKLRIQYGLKTTTEFHTKHFMLNKKEYLQLNLSDSERIEIMDLFCDLIGGLDLKIINVVINKKRISDRKYDILDRALTYSIQRIENDLETSLDSDERFMIITDPGREGKMRITSRRIQKINYIPSKLHKGTTYEKTIARLIEDPLPKESKESHFIQISDLVSFIVYQHMIKKLNVGPYHGRMPAEVNQAKVVDWLERLKSRLNLAASTADPYGIVCYPK